MRRYTFSYTANVLKSAERHLRLTTLSLAVICLMTACVHASSATTHDGGKAPAVNTYTNPVWPHDFPDPFVLHYGNKYYAYATATQGYNGLQVIESSDLVHWSHRQVAFKPPWSNSDYWAPEVDLYKGRLYMIYSALDPVSHRHDIAIAVGDHPTGPFTHHAILVKGTDANGGAIDADLFFDHEGRVWLIYSEENPRSIAIQELDPTLSRTITDPVVVLRPVLPQERGVTEAPTLIYRDGHFILFFSGGTFQSDTKQDASYMVEYAVSSKLLGPYTRAAKPLLQSVQGSVYGPGHQCVLTLPNGDMWMFYHGWDNEGEPHYGGNPLGRTLRIDPVTWHDGLPTMDGPTTTPQPDPRVSSGKGSE